MARPLRDAIVRRCVSTKRTASVATAVSQLWPGPESRYSESGSLSRAPCTATTIAGRPRQLALDHESGQPDRRQRSRARVAQIARLPAREELRVEAVEALDLEPPARQPEQPAGDAVEQAARAAQRTGKRCKVERDLL